MCYCSFEEEFWVVDVVNFVFNCGILECLCWDIVKDGYKGLDDDLYGRYDE